jgi:hypothetical protein
MTEYKRGLWFATMTLAAMAAVSIGITVASSVAMAGSTTEKLEGELISSDGIASGTGKWERRGGTSCNQRRVRCKLSVEVEDFPKDGSFAVTACGANIGNIAVVNGFGDLNLDTGLRDIVPNCSAGNSVTVGDVLSGTLQIKP